MKCRDCMLTELSNPKNPICNYHQGVQEGKQKLWDDLVKEDIICEKGKECDYCKEIKKRHNLK